MIARRGGKNKNEKEGRAFESVSVNAGTEDVLVGNQQSHRQLVCTGAVVDRSSSAAFRTDPWRSSQRPSQAREPCLLSRKWPAIDCRRILRWKFGRGGRRRVQHSRRSNRCVWRWNGFESGVG